MPEKNAIFCPNNKFSPKSWGGCRPLTPPEPCAYGNRLVVDDADVDSANPEILTVEEDDDNEDDDVEIEI